MSTNRQRLMKAVRIHQYGGQEELELEEVTIPTPAEGEVLIKVHAAGVNPLDWKVRQGYLAEIIPHQLPLTLGWDVAGEVVAIGGRVKQWKMGDAVYGRPDFTKNGAYAEYMVVSADEIATKPASLNWLKSAAVPLVTLSAWQALHDLAGVKAGERVLIHAGAGGVGMAAIQLALLAGAVVYTTASTDNIEFLNTLGAHEVIDYTQRDFSELSDLDIVVDTLGGETLEKSWGVLKKGGRLVSFVEPPTEEKAKTNQATAHFCFVQPNAKQLTSIAEHIDAGELAVEIDRVFPLEERQRLMRKAKRAILAERLFFK